MKKILEIINNSKQTLAYLNNLESGTVRKVINGEYIISFIALIEPLKTEFLHDSNNLIKYDNDYFNIISIEEEHNSDNMLKVYVNCEHISYDLIKQTKLSYTETNRSAIYVMNDLLLNSGFNFLGTDVLTTASIDIQRETDIKSLLYLVTTIWGGELSYFQNDIELKQQLGTNRGVDFRFGKNIQNIKRLLDRVESTVSYEVEIVQGTELEELGYFQLGDTIKVVDEGLNIELDIRIIEIEKDLVTGLNSSVILGQPINDLSSTINNIFNTFKSVGQTELPAGLDEAIDNINNVVDEHGNLIASKLSGSLNTAITKVQNSTGKVLFDDRGLITINQPLETSSTKALLITADGILIANAKNTNGTWKWRTAITADGINANEINTGTLTAININGVNITGSTITSTSVDTNVVMDSGTLQFKKNNSTGNIKFAYRQGLPLGVDSYDVRGYERYKNGIPADEKTLGLQCADANFGIELGENQFSINSFYGTLNITGGIEWWDEAGNPDSQYYIPEGWYKTARTSIYNDGFTIELGEYGTISNSGFNVYGGVKNAIINTETYGDIAFSAYEMSEVLLGDIGQSKVENGKVLIPIHQAFIESVDISEYHVFLTKYGKGDIWVSERTPTHFIVEGDDIPFSWEIKANRKDASINKFMPTDINQIKLAIKELIEEKENVKTYTIPSIENSMKIKQKELYKEMLLNAKNKKEHHLMKG